MRLHERVPVFVGAAHLAPVATRLQAQWAENAAALSVALPAPELLHNWIEALPDVNVFVAGLGTGGTLMGVGRRLKEHNPEARLVAVAPEPEDFISGLRSLEEGFIPPILDISLLDSRMLVSSFDAFSTAKRLLTEEGIFAGVSSGSVVYGAIRHAERMDKGDIVCLLADGGWKYLSTALWTKDYEELAKEAKGKIWW